jgi:hypothetical protein
MVAIRHCQVKRLLLSICDHQGIKLLLRPFL